MCTDVVSVSISVIIIDYIIIDALWIVLCYIQRITFIAAWHCMHMVHDIVAIS